MQSIRSSHCSRLIITTSTTVPLATAQSQKTSPRNSGLASWKTFLQRRFVALRRRLLPRATICQLCIKCSMPAAMSACLRACHRHIMPIRKRVISLAQKQNSSGLIRRCMSPAVNVAGIFLPIPLNRKPSVCLPTSTSSSASRFWRVRHSLLRNPRFWRKLQ